MRTKLVGLMLVALLVSVTAACSEATEGTDSDGGTRQSATIAEITALHGVSAAYGEQIREGAQIAIEQAEDLYPDLDLEFIHEDNNTDRAQTIALTRRFAADEQVMAIVGPNSSPEAIAMAPIAAQAGLPVLPSGAQAPFPEYNEWTFVVPFQNEEVIDALMAYVTESTDIQTAHILHTRDLEYSVAAEELYRMAAEEAGIEIVGSSSIAFADVDYAAAIDQIVKSDADSLWMSLLAGNAGAFLLQAGDRLPDLILGETGIENEQVWDLSDGAIAGALTAVPFFARDPQGEIQQAFVSDFEAANDNLPTVLNAMGFDAMRVAIEAIAIAASEDNLSRKGVQEALQVMEFEGVTGSISWPEGFGAPVRESLTIGRYQDGYLSPVKEIVLSDS